jgi:hypothetical protein
MKAAFPAIVGKRSVFVDEQSGSWLIVVDMERDGSFVEFATYLHPSIPAPSRPVRFPTWDDVESEAERRAAIVRARAN